MQTGPDERPPLLHVRVRPRHGRRPRQHRGLLAGDLSLRQPHRRLCLGNGGPCGPPRRRLLHLRRRPRRVRERRQLLCRRHVLSGPHTLRRCEDHQVHLSSHPAAPPLWRCIRTVQHDRLLGRRSLPDDRHLERRHHRRRPRHRGSAPEGPRHGAAGRRGERHTDCRRRGQGQEGGCRRLRRFHHPETGGHPRSDRHELPGGSLRRERPLHPEAPEWQDPDDRGRRHPPLPRRHGQRLHLRHLQQHAAVLRSEGGPEVLREDRLRIQGGF